MKHLTLTRRIILFGILCWSVVQLWAANQENPMKANAKYDFKLTIEEWKEKLTPMQFHVAREAGTERAFTGEYWNHKEDGIYHCVGCNEPLYDSKDKFDSGTGWPSYSQAVEEGKIREFRDSSLGMERVEIVCNNCGTHLGHVFPDGPLPTRMRHCVNSASLKFVPR